MSMSGWLQNAVSYNKNKDAGKCPKCGSADVQVEEYVHGSRRSLSFTCSSCGNGAHLDGGKANGKG